MNFHNLHDETQEQRYEIFRKYFREIHGMLNNTYYPIDHTTDHYYRISNETKGVVNLNREPVLIMIVRGARNNASRL